MKYSYLSYNYDKEKKNKDHLRRSKTTDVKPDSYRGFDIFEVHSQLYDIVKDGVCISQYAGPNGAKQAIDKYCSGGDYVFQPSMTSLSERNDAIEAILDFDNLKEDLLKELESAKERDGTRTVAARNGEPFYVLMKTDRENEAPLFWSKTRNSGPDRIIFITGNELDSIHDFAGYRPVNLDYLINKIDEKASMSANMQL